MTTEQAAADLTPAERLAITARWSLASAWVTAELDVLRRIEDRSSPMWREMAIRRHFDRQDDGTLDPACPPARQSF